MKTPKRPAEGWPWEQPGFTFQIGWPPGFVPSESKATIGAAERSRRASANRDQQVAKGITGSLRGMSKKSDARLEQTVAATIARAKGNRT